MTEFDVAGAAPTSVNRWLFSLPVTLLFTFGLIVASVSSAAAQTTCPCSLWTMTTTPGPRDSEVAALELGVKFRADVAGVVTGIRFYKYSQNTGTHVGNLWTAGGVLLGTVTFTGETSSGWQQALFATPIAITANTTYVASYHTNTGSYAATESGFTIATDTPPLHALASGSSGGNGVYRAGTNSLFPNQTYNATNYWVDVVFQPSGGTDTTPPVITANTPANGASNVPTNTTVTVTFNEPMNAATITSSTIQLRTTAGASISGAVSYNATTRVATFTPTSALANNTSYTSTVTTGVQDVAGNALASSFSSAFMTVAGDLTPPVITAQTPADGATGVPITTTVTVTFSEPMNAGTMTSSNLQLQTSAGTPVAASVTYNATTRVATMAPNAPLANGAGYTATVTSGVQDLAGNPLAAVSWSFTTVAADVTPPVITAKTPADGASGVSATTTVTATFSESMNAATISTTTFSLRAGAAAVAASVAYNATTRVATLTPTAALAPQTSYTVTVSAAVADVAGNALGVDTSWSFMTAAGSVCPCSIWTMTTTPGPMDSEAGALELGVKFRSDVDGVITGIRFYKYAQNSGTHVGNLWTSSGTLLRTVTFSGETASGWQQAIFATPVAIVANTTYVASYHTNTGFYAATGAGLTNAKDTPPLHALASAASGGNGVYRAGASSLFPNQTYNASNYWVDVVFEMSGPDVTRPIITANTPTNGAANVPTNTIITATFNEAMNAATVSSSTVRLQTASGTEIAGTVSYNATTRVATLTPGAPLVNNTSYTATVTTGVQDVAGNAMASDFSWSFTVSNTVLTQLGQWSSVRSWPLVTLNAVTLKTGEVLVWDGGTSVGDPPTHGGLSARLWNPTTETFTSVPLPTTDLFCTGFCSLPDGRVFTAGGGDPSNNNVGVPDANIFDPVTRSWSAVQPMHQRRWYPTTTCLPDGRVLVTSGSQFTDTDFVTVPEIYNPATNTWTRLTGAQANIPYYPHEFVLSDGRILTSSTNRQAVASTVLNLSTQVRSTVDSKVFDGGSAVMFRPDKVLKAGTAASNSGSTAPSQRTAYVLDMTQPPNRWRAVGSMNFPRAYHMLTVLPDGTVLATGGGRNKDSTNVAGAVYEAEIWSPVSETWTTMARMERPRLYHSTAVLLPDARVLVAGGGRNFNSSQKELNAEIYSPPYLFKGPRPTITSVTGDGTYGSSLFVNTPDAAQVTSVALLRPGAATHSFDEDQRYVPLTFQQSGGGLNIQAPANANLAPPGYYMLFIVNSTGVPSVASFVRIGP